MTFVRETKHNGKKHCIPQLNKQKIIPSDKNYKSRVVFKYFGFWFKLRIGFFSNKKENALK
jgi:hypothetical protein